MSVFFTTLIGHTMSIDLAPVQLNSKPTVSELSIALKKLQNGKRLP